MNKQDSADLKQKSSCILNQSIRLSTRISRYMSFDVFLQLLEGKLFVPRKMIFLDSRECGLISMKNQFSLNVVSENGKESMKYITSKQKKIDKYIENLKQSQYLLTSCWTLDDGDNYLMWESYASDIGVCVCTTIGDLINAIEFEKDGYLPICSQMAYGNVSIPMDFLESVFTKDKYYYSENEVRLYFIPKSVSDNYDLKMITRSEIQEILFKASEIEKIVTNNTTNTNATFKFFDIRPEFIHSVILSPKIKSSSICCFKRILKDQYPIVFDNDNMIRQSNIQIN